MTRTIKEAWQEFLERKSGGTSLYEYYYPRVKRVARQALPTDEDAEDVAQNVLATFFRRAMKGDYQAEDERRLWGLLKTITVRRRANYWRDMLGKRDGEIVDADLGSKISLDEFAEHARTDDFELALREMLEELKDTSLCEIALFKLESHTNHWIAEQLGMSESSVRRKLKMIAAKIGDFSL